MLRHLAVKKLTENNKTFCNGFDIVRCGKILSNDMMQSNKLTRGAGIAIHVDVIDIFQFSCKKYSMVYVHSYFVKKIPAHQLFSECANPMHILKLQITLNLQAACKENWYRPLGGARWMRETVVASGATGNIEGSKGEMRAKKCSRRH